MRAIRRDERETQLVHVPVPVAGAGETLVRVECAGVCRTDLHVARGRLRVRTPRTLGHELAGTTSAGAAVAVVPWLVCGDCAACARAGAVDPPRCDRPSLLGVEHDGAFAEYVVVPTSSLLPLPPRLSWRRAAFVEPLAAALAVLSAPIGTAQRGLVLGASRIAELTRRVLVAAGFTQLDCADADFVIDTDGTADSLLHALQVVTNGGRVVVKSRPFAPIAFDVALAVRRDLTLHAVNYGSFRTALGWLAEDRLEVDDLFDEPAPLTDYVRVLAEAESGPAKKQFFAPNAR